MHQSLNKYKDLQIEIGKIWKLKTRTIFVAIGVQGRIAKWADSYLAQIPGKPQMTQIQKIVLSI